MVALGDQSHGLTAVLVQREVVGDGQAGDGRLAPGPLDHPRHAEDEGEDREPHHEPLVVGLQVDRLAVQQRDHVGEAGRRRRHVDPLARPDDGARALDGQPRMDVPAAGAPPGQRQPEVVDAALVTEEGLRHLDPVDDPVPQRELRARLHHGQVADDRVAVAQVDGPALEDLGGPGDRDLGALLDRAPGEVDVPPADGVHAGEGVLRPLPVRRGRRGASHHEAERGHRRPQPQQSPAQ